MQKWIAIICIIGGSLATAWGQSGRDYTAGFDRLFMLGLADVSEAEYVKLTMQGHHRFFTHDWQWRRMELEGNAWLLDTDEDGLSRYLFNDGRIIHVYEPEHLQRVRREEAEATKTAVSQSPFDTRDARISGTSEPADLSADLQKAMVYLRGEDEDDSRRSMRRHELDAISGRLFVFAALAHRHGHVSEATELVDTLFAIAPEPREIILGGLDHIANQQYADLFHAWLMNREWETYAVELQTLIERFRAGWTFAPVAERVRGDLEQRLDDSGPPMLEGISEKKQSLAIALADAEPLGMQRQHGFWIFPRSAWQQSHFMGRLSQDHPISQIKAKGLDAIPLLLAMLDDRFPTPMSWHDVVGSRTTFSGRRQQVADEQMVWRYFDSMQRPAARGDVARALLGQIIRDEEHGSVSGQSPDQVRASAEEWWERFGELSVDDIARIYLLEGIKDQRAAAGLHLLHTGDEKDVALVQDAITSADDPVDVAELVLNYARVKGQDSRELVEPFMEQLRDALEHLEGERAWQRHGLQQVLNNLETLLSDETLDTYLADLLAGESEFDQWTFNRVAGREPLRRALRLVLDTLVGTDDSQIQAMLTTALLSTRHWQAMGRQFQLYEVDTEEPGAWMIDDFSEHWRTLMDSTNVVSGQLSLPAPMEVRIAIVLLLLSGEQDVYQHHYPLWSRAGKQGHAYYVKWARQRLDDPTMHLPPLPSADDVTAEERMAITERLMEGNEETFETLLDELSIQERLALHEVLSENDELRQHLLSFANRIVHVGPSIGGEHDEGIESVASASSFSEELIDSLLNFLKAELTDGHSTQIHIIRTASLDGIIIEYGATPLSHLRAHQRTNEEPHVMATIATHGQFLTVRWPMEETISDSSEDDEFDLFDDMLMDLDEQVSRTQDEQREQFWNHIQRILNGEKPSHRHFHIALRSLPKLDEETP